MDMKELFENGCFTPAWTEREEVPEPVKDEIVPQRKDVTVLLDELADIKDILRIRIAEHSIAKII